MLSFAVNSPQHPHEKPDRESDWVRGYDEAEAWFAKRLGDHWSEQNEIEFLSWRAESERNAIAYAEVERAFELVPDVPGPELAAKIAHSLPDEKGKAPALRVSRRSALAAGITISAASIFFGQHWIRNRPSRHVTGLGERRQVSLADGTEIYLDSSTTVLIRETEQIREVTIESGRAVYDVVHDPEKPFEVISEFGKIRVLGTVFETNVISPRHSSLVSTDSGLLEVKLEEGSVSLGLTEPELEKAPVTLIPGQIATRKAGDPSLELSEFNPGEFASWRSGRLVYRDRPLKYVLADLQREY
ncbi:MAG: FecR domain-containing protein, partial [Verrucomicrobiota bacterium]